MRLFLPKKILDFNLRTSFAENFLKIENSTTPNLTLLSVHQPFGRENFEMRNFAIIFIEFYGILFLSIKMILSYSNKKKSFFNKSVKSLVKQSNLYFLFMTFIYILYVFGALDNLKNNWEFFLGGVGMLGIIWIFLNITIIIFSTMIIKKWEEVEEYAQSFCNLFF